MGVKMTIAQLSTRGLRSGERVRVVNGRTVYVDAGWMWRPQSDNQYFLSRTGDFNDRRYMPGFTMVELLAAKPEQPVAGDPRLTAAAAELATVLLEALEVVDQDMESDGGTLESPASRHAKKLSKRIRAVLTKAGVTDLPAPPVES